MYALLAIFARLPRERFSASDRGHLGKERSILEIIFSCMVASLIVFDCLISFSDRSSLKVAIIPFIMLSIAFLILIAVRRRENLFSQPSHRFATELVVYAALSVLLSFIALGESWATMLDYRSVSLCIVGIMSILGSRIRSSAFPILLGIIIAVVLIGHHQILVGNINITLFLLCVGAYPLIWNLSVDERRAIITTTTVILGYLTLNVSFLAAATGAAIVCRASFPTIMTRLVAAIWVYLIETPAFQRSFGLPLDSPLVLTHERAVVWTHAIECWLSTPLTGSPHCIRDVYGDIYSHFHNTIFTALAFNGILGGVLAIWFGWRIWSFGRAQGAEEFTAIFLAWSFLDEPLYFFSVATLFVLTLSYHPQVNKGRGNDMLIGPKSA